MEEGTEEVNAHGQTSGLTRLSPFPFTEKRPRKLEEGGKVDEGKEKII